MGNKGTIFDAAYYILTKINQTTFMNLQRLCYYAQAWSITWDKFALFEEEFEAWAGGPFVQNFIISLIYPKTSMSMQTNLSLILVDIVFLKMKKKHWISSSKFIVIKNLIG